MELLVGCLAVLILAASVVDWILKDKAIVTLRRELQETGEKITDLDASAVALAANRLFCEIFDTLYGSRTWSRRRFLRSCFLSVLFVIFAVLIIGFDNTFLGSEIDLGEIVYIVVVFSFINLLADFLSLQETRWILGRASGKGTVALIYWVWIDLMLTTAIYIAVLGSAVVVHARLIVGVHLPILDMLWRWQFLEQLFFPDQALPFFVSTFGTSIVWFLFAGFVFLIRAMGRSSRVLKLALDIISKSAAPARTAAGIVAVPVVMVFGVVKTVRWLF